jgi:hypothetical protein
LLARFVLPSASGNKLADVTDEHQGRGWPGYEVRVRLKAHLDVLAIDVLADDARTTAEGTRSREQP